MNFGRMLKKALKRNKIRPLVFVAWSAIARDKPRRQLMAHSTPTPSHPAPSPPTPNQLSANLNAPFPDHGDLALPTWSRLDTHPSPKRNTPKRAPPTAPPGTPPAPALHLSSTISRKAPRSATE